MEPDNKLLKKAAKADVAAFEKLVTNYEKHIYNISYRMLGNVEDARDASQEILIKIYRNIGKCQDIKALKSWITAISTNACIDFLRKKKRIVEISLDTEIETDDGKIEQQLPSDEPTPEEQAVYKEIRTDIAAALAKLPDTFRILVVMRDIYGLSYNEIAFNTGIQLGTVKSRLSRARNNLRLLLEKEEQKNNPRV